VRLLSSVLVVSSVIALAGCGGQSESAPTTEPPTISEATTTTAASPPLVGRWERVNKCPELVGALEDAGLGEIAPGIVGDYFPDVPAAELATKKDICTGAEPFVHSHFFDAAGRFGSLDAEENQVDDGTYEILDDRRFRIGNPDVGVTFRYEIDGDRLSLSPVITETMVAEALANPLEFSDAGWSVAVSYPGQEWRRVPCGRWC